MRLTRLPLAIQYIRSHTSRSKHRRQIRLLQVFLPIRNVIVSCAGSSGKSIFIIVIGDQPGQHVERFLLWRQLPAKPVQRLRHRTEMLPFAIVRDHLRQRLRQ